MDKYHFSFSLQIFSKHSYLFSCDLQTQATHTSHMQRNWSWICPSCRDHNQWVKRLWPVNVELMNTRIMLELLFILWAPSVRPLRTSCRPTSPPDAAGLSIVFSLKPETTVFLLCLFFLRLLQMSDLPSLSCSSVSCLFVSFREFPPGQPALPHDRLLHLQRTCQCTAVEWSNKTQPCFIMLLSWQQYSFSWFILTSFTCCFINNDQVAALASYPTRGDVIM